MQRSEQDGINRTGTIERELEGDGGYNRKELIDDGERCIGKIDSILLKINIDYMKTLGNENCAVKK